MAGSGVFTCFDCEMSSRTEDWDACDDGIGAYCPICDADWDIGVCDECDAEDAVRTVYEDKKAIGVFCFHCATKEA